jgi:hypothetical protein
MSVRPHASRLALVTVLALAASCGEGSPTSPDSPFVSVEGTAVTVAFDFRDGLQGWTGEYGATRWPSGNNAIFDSRVLPAPLNTSQRAFYMTGGTGMRLAKRRVTGIPAGRSFRATFTVEVATNEPTGCFSSIAGFITDVEASAHASASEPVMLTDSSGQLRPEWTAPGSVALGKVTSGAPCRDPRIWVLKTLTGVVTSVTPDDRGRLWLSFMARDTNLFDTPDGRPFYITRYEVRLTDGP